ncbi:MAG: tyrosine recombinase XerC [Candidatus Improbicoccus pseudotrichonymphae]|uniref:Tyrosine recombinase XerC n=1 Tax=Candidatus Improbicoccus pseudotrichonymphae TaxID=3033792 RepID=A0AA48KVF7_9FIRM|nr:MAG: tyrosine recombinase XerC [Candidatus Improbicoccus pseudotrichonymphae]
MIWRQAPKIMLDFLIYLKNVRGKSDNTVLEYFFDLRTFFRYLKFKDIKDKNIKFDSISIDYVDIETIKKIDVVEVLEYMSFLAENKNNNSNTRSRKTSSLRSFFKYLGKNIKILEENPMEEVGSPKKKKSIPKFLDLEQSKKLLECINKNSNKNSTRDFCIITFFLNCGMRLSELVGINISDIKDDGSLKITGKGNKERIIYLNEACKVALNAYLHVRVLPNNKDKNALFTSRNRRRISVKTIQHLTKKYFTMSGLEDKGFSVHKLRHTAATLMYYAGIDIKILKEILGHEHINTTEIYTHTSDKQLKDAVELNPLSNVAFINLADFVAQTSHDTKE